MVKKNKNKAPKGLKHLSYDLAEEKHNFFFDASRIVKNEFRERLAVKIGEKIKGRANLLWNLRSLAVDADFIADAVSEWCFTFANKHYEHNMEIFIHNVAVAIMNTIISQDAFEREKLSSEEKKKLMKVSNRYRKYYIKHNMKQIQMNQEHKIQIGIALVNEVIGVSVDYSDVQVFDVYKAGKALKLCFHDDFVDYIKMRDMAISDSYFTKTPVYELQKWTSFNNGGFLNYFVPLIKTDVPEKYASQKLPKSILDYVNTCQNVRFVVGEKMYDYISTQRETQNTEIGLYSKHKKGLLKHVNFSYSNKIAKHKKTIINQMKDIIVDEIAKGLTNKSPQVRFLYRSLDLLLFFQDNEFFNQLYDSIERFVTTETTNYYQKLHKLKKREKYHLKSHWERRKLLIKKINEQQGKYYQQNLTDRIAKVMIEDGNLPFKYVFTLDYRGRIYASTVGLNPQGDKMSKNLIRFENKTKLGKYGFGSLLWLLAGLADEKLKDGCKLSKASFDERLEWSKANYDMLVDIGNNPLDHQGYINESGEPLEFVQACFELADIDKWIRDGNDVMFFASNFICRLDATCSGSQAMSIILKDLILAQSVNVAYSSERVQDYYAKHIEIFENIEDYLHEIPKDNLKVYQKNDYFKKYHGLINRKHVKRAVMTYCYSVSMLSATDYIIVELKNNPEIDKKDHIWLARLLWECVLIGGGATTKVMRWYQKCTEEIYNQIGTYEMSWICPDGMTCYDIRRRNNSKTISTVLGKREYQVVLKSMAEIDNKKNKTSISPNITHSIDKFVLGNTMLEMKKLGCNDFAPIHDSLGVPLGFAHRVVECVNKSHVKLYNMDYLNKVKSYWEEKYNVNLPPLPVAEKELNVDFIKNANNPFC